MLTIKYILRFIGMLLFVLALEAHSQPLQATDKNISGCLFGDVSACKNAVDDLNSKCMKSPDGSAARKCADQAIAVQRIIEANARYTQICSASGAEQCSWYKTNVIEKLQDDLKKGTDGTFVNPPKFQYSSIGATCNGTVSSNNEVAQAILNRIIEQFQLYTASQAEKNEIEKYIISDAVTVREITVHLLQKYSIDYIGKDSTEAAVRRLAAQAFSGTNYSVSDNQINTWVNLAQTQGGLNPVIKQIFESDAYLNLVGDNLVPGNKVYLPCKIDFPEDVVETGVDCRQASPDASSKKVFSVPRGYNQWGGWIVTSQNPATNDHNGYYAGMDACDSYIRSYTLIANAHRHYSCPAQGSVSWLINGPRSWVSAKVSFHGQFIGYVVGPEPADRCRPPPKRPDWASGTISCGPRLPDKGSCDITVSTHMTVDIFSQNRCFMKGSKIGSFTLNPGDIRHLDVDNKSIFYEIQGQNPMKTYLGACDGNMKIDPANQIISFPNIGTRF